MVSKTNWLSHSARTVRFIALNIGVLLGLAGLDEPKSDNLTPKVMAVIEEGRSYRWIARDFGIGKNTVDGIVARGPVNP